MPAINPWFIRESVISYPASCNICLFLWFNSWILCFINEFKIAFMYFTAHLRNRGLVSSVHCIFCVCSLLSWLVFLSLLMCVNVSLCLKSLSSSSFALGCLHWILLLVFPVTQYAHGQHSKSRQLCISGSTSLFFLNHTKLFCFSYFKSDCKRRFWVHMLQPLTSPAALLCVVSYCTS